MNLRINQIITRLKMVLGLKLDHNLSRIIVGVPTTITVFIGYASSGVALKPKKLNQYSDYENEFGINDPNSDLASSVKLFFINGGSECYVVNIKDSKIDSTDNIKELYNSAINALDTVDIFNLLIITKLMINGVKLSDKDYLEILSIASEYCKKRRAFLLIDPLDVWNTWEDVTQHNTLSIETMRSFIDDENSAVYFPRLEVEEFDPSQNKQVIKKIGPAAAIAGVITRIDNQQGVWKAPAGMDAKISGITGLDLDITDSQGDNLNQEAVNCLRNFNSEILIWGARTVVGTKNQSSEWKYVSTKRLFLYLEESIDRGTKWVVFEPSEEPTWEMIRVFVNEFMHELFKLGAFLGATPKEAYFIECDNKTVKNTSLGTTTAIIVGFAPLKPAEFIVIHTEHITKSE